MLGKLMKHEWRATKRILIPVNLTIIIITVVECLLFACDVLYHKNSIPLVFLLILLYALSLIALATVSSIYLYVRFYKNLFTHEGYLMFTLPVTPLQLVNSKLIIGMVWTFINIILSAGSLFAIVFSGTYFSAKHGVMKEDFLADLSSVLSGGTTTATSFKEIFGYSVPEFLIVCVITLLISSFFSLAMGYLAIALGQLIEKYKLACSIGFYIALYVVTQIISSCFMIIVNIRNITNASEDFLGASMNIYQSVLPATAVLSLILGIVFYIITLLIIRKKVNLD